MDPNEKPPPVTWLVPGFIMRGKINVMFGPEKAGKSRLMAYLLAHAFYELPIWRGPTMSPGRTLYLAGEETRADVTARLVAYAKLIGQHPAAIPWADNLTFVDAAGMRLDRAEQRRWLRSELESGAYATLVIDPLRRVHGAKESSNDEMSFICNDMREWSNTLGTTLLLLHHTGKLSDEDDDDRIATWSRGASDLPAVLDWATYVVRHLATEGSGAIDRVVVKRRGRGPSRDTLTLLDMGENGLWQKAHGRL